MVDFGELRDKAESLVAENSDKIKAGLGKVGDLVGDRIGHDKVDGVEGKLSGFIDKIAGDHAAPKPPAPPPFDVPADVPSAPPVVPPVARDVPPAP